MRLGCWLVSLAVLASLVLEPPRAKAADALTLAAVDGGSALLFGYLAACGMTPFSTGMNARDMTGMSEELLREYIDEEFGGEGGGGPSLNDWLGMISFTVANGVVRFGKAAADKLNQFATWVAGKYGTKAGVNVIYNTDGFYSFQAESTFASSLGAIKLFFDYPSSVTVTPPFKLDLSSSFVSDVAVTLERGVYEFRFFPVDEVSESLNCFVLYGYSNCSTTVKWETLGTRWIRLDASNISSDTFNINFSFKVCIPKTTVSSALTLPIDTTKCWIKRLDKSESSFGIDVSETMQQVLDRLSALEEGQSIALDVGAAQSMEIQEILQNILEKILAGDLSATAEVVDTAEVPVEPPEEPEPPVVPEIPEGLDKLGAALTSRFPFSIPWDVYKGVTLLAAPPKAPYFEVDFLEPIGHLVGGWKGSTKIVLDMSEYEIIGQVCRWTSTIGFCLMLASGTKRLIWTA